MTGKKDCDTLEQEFDIHGQGGRQPETEDELQAHIELIEAERPLNTLEEKIRANSAREREKETVKYFTDKKKAQEKNERGQQRSNRTASSVGGSDGK